MSTIRTCYRQRAFCIYWVALTLLMIFLPPIKARASASWSLGISPHQNQSAQPGLPRFEPSDCLFQVTEGDRIECGYLVVPEDRSQPEGPTIQLAVAILKSHSANPAPDPVIFLAGGPGDSGLAWVDTFRRSSLRETRDFILIDQRGTGYSKPSLQCEEWTAAVNRTRGQNSWTDESINLRIEAAKQCHDRLVGEGINLSTYTSAAIAADLNDLRLVLGYKEWNLYSRSYGGRLALTAMRDYPEGIRSVILDSPFPLQVNLYEEIAANMDRAFNTLFTGCAADPACQAAYPDSERIFNELVDRFNAHPVSISAPDSVTGISRTRIVTGNDIINGLFTALYDTRLIPYLPLAGYQIYAGNNAVLVALTSQTTSDPSRLSRGMRWSVQCYEEVPFNDPDKIKASLEAYPRLRDYVTRDYGPELATCANWGVGKAGPIENEPVRSDIPALVTAGEYDPVIPPAWSKMVAENLSHSYYFEFPGVGHGASTGSACQTSVRDSFVYDPTVAPDASCIAEMKGPAFVTDVYTNPGIFQLATRLLQKREPLQVGWIAFCVLLFLSAIITLPMGILTPHRRKGWVITSGVVRLAYWLAWVVAALNLAFIIGLSFYLWKAISTDQNILLFGLPSAARPLFFLPLLTAGLGIVLLVFTGLAWVNRYWTKKVRAYYSLLTLASIGFTGWLLYLGLLKL